MKVRASDLNLGAKIGTLELAPQTALDLKGVFHPRRWELRILGYHEIIYYVGYLKIIYSTGCLPNTVQSSARLERPQQLRPSTPADILH